MTLKQTEFVTEITALSSAQELAGAQIGQPCLLIVHGDALSTDTDLAALRDFLADAPFMTALAAEKPSAELAPLFDLLIDPAFIDDYTADLFKDMTPKQAHEITNCFVIARKGTAQDILDAESRAFYRLIAEKTGGTTNA